MRIAVVSDTHSRYATVRSALGLLRQKNVECVLHCGDIEDAETVELFRGLPAHFVYGNCDTDRETLREAIAANGLTLHEPFGHLKLAGRNIAFTHGDDKTLLRDLEASEAFDFLFYGHTHVAQEHRTGSTRVINPGALHRARPKTFVVLDLNSGSMESVVVDAT